MSDVQNKQKGQTGGGITVNINILSLIFRIDHQPVFSEVTEHVTLFGLTDTQQDRSFHGGHMYTSVALQ